MRLRSLRISIVAWSCALALASTLPAEEPAAVQPVDAPFAPPVIHVPDGFTVELVAGPPLVKHPMMACFDERGRLFVAESAGLNLRNNDLEEQLPNFVRMLEDTDGDGRFDKSTIFADKMTFPMGGCWLDGSLYVASPPNIWKLTDSDDDGVADQREILVSKFGYNGNAADVHGCFAGPDGRIYWCDGRHGHEFQDSTGLVTSKGKAARIFSCKTDGSDVQVHCGGGMDNPVEIDFMPNGDMLGTVNLLYRQRGDCLVHWMHGGVYPREDQVDCIAEFRRTGELLTPMYDFGHVAISGMTRYRGTQFDHRFTDDIFVTEFNAHSVKRVGLEFPFANGSSYGVGVEEFLRAESDDFHPTDVLEDADGSLLVIDTGGWFRIGCPTSQIAKPNILGAIYRVRFPEGRPVEDPRGGKLSWDGPSNEALIDRLADGRPAVRERAIAALAKLGDAAVPALDKVLFERKNVDSQCGCLWALTRIGTAKAQGAVRNYLVHTRDSVRQVAMYSAGQTRDRAAVHNLNGVVISCSPWEKRIAATSLGRIGDAVAVPVLLNALAEENDLLLDHALRYALIEIHDREKTLAGLWHDSPRVRLGALIALDQMEGGNLTSSEVLPLLNTDEPALRAAALEIVGKHPAWARETVVLLRDWLTDETQLREPGQVRNLHLTLLNLQANEAVQQLVGELLASDATSADAERLLLDVIAGSELKPLPMTWYVALLKLLHAPELERRELAINTIAAADSDSFDAALLASAADTNLPQAVRDTALLVPAKHGCAVSGDQFARLLELLKAEQAVVRLGAAEALGAAGLTEQQLANLLPAISRSEPLELPALVAAFQPHATDETTETTRPDAQLGLKLVAALEQAPGKTSLSAARLNELLAAYPAEVRTAAAKLLAALNAGQEEQAARLAELLPRMAGGNAVLGKDVFYSQRATCSSCHRIEKQGALIGPELTGIGKRRNLRDLAEAVLFPSASLARDFESYAIATSSGQVHTGLILRQTSHTLLVRTTQQKEVTIARDDVEELAPSPVSIMPQGLDRVLNEEQLRDLLAYLESLK